jgi:hypothetical protein
VTLAELRQHWTHRRDEWRRLGVQVDGAKLADEILAELEQLDAAGEQLLTLVEASEESGYSANHLGRLVRSGDIPNAGRSNAPKIRRRDLPHKAPPLQSPAATSIVSTDRRRIAASVLNLHQRGQDG